MHSLAPMADDLEAGILERLRAGDVTAPAEFCERYLPRLLADLRWVPPGVRDEHLITDVAIQTTLNFVRNPARYDPARLGLIAYLRMDAAGDIRNLLKSERQRAARLAPLEAVELGSAARKDIEETRDLPDGVTEDLLVRLIHERLPDPRDREAVALMLDGVRETAVYARVFGITHLPTDEQRKEVKRRKDRLDKVLKRLGARLRDGGR
jgi:hypothetical protein